MKKITTVQDLIDELSLVDNKNAELNIMQTDGYLADIYTPNSYDFSVIVGDNEDVVTIIMYR